MNDDEDTRRKEFLVDKYLRMAMQEENEEAEAKKNPVKVLEEEEWQPTLRGRDKDFDEEFVDVLDPANLDEDEEDSFLEKEEEEVQARKPVPSLRPVPRVPRARKGKKRKKKGRSRTRNSAPQNDDDGGSLGNRIRAIPTEPFDRFRDKWEVTSFESLD